MANPSGLPGGEAPVPMTVEEDNNLVAMDEALEAPVGDEPVSAGKAHTGGAPPTPAEQARAVQVEEDRPLQAGQQMYILDMGCAP